MNILIADEMHPSLIPMLEADGFAVAYRPLITRPEMMDCLAAYHGLILRSKTPLDAPLLGRATRLRFIGRAGAGLDLIDLDTVEQRGIHLMNAPEGNRDAVAEHAVGMLLGLLNHLLRADRQVRQGIWRREENRGTEIGGKTVAIIGYGNTGRAFAKRLGSFGCRVLAYDAYLRGYADDYARESDMEAIFEQADVLSLHVPLTEQTRTLVDEAYLRRFRKDLYVINTSRGEVLESRALLAALQTGKVLGAGLDVLENEKLG
ncbi:MAG: phosphoglycerate dehydrogenase, partial [Ferruginibacter sp.]|nr:phosphoglycerate dehydrogenase [Cytophagales bacterium]